MQINIHPLSRPHHGAYKAFLSRSMFWCQNWHLTYWEKHPGEEKCGLKPKSSWAGIAGTDAGSCWNEDSLVLDNITHPFSSRYGRPELCTSVRADMGCTFVSSRKVRTEQWLDSSSALAVTGTAPPLPRDSWPVRVRKPATFAAIN